MDLTAEYAENAEEERTVFFSATSAFSAVKMYGRKLFELQRNGRRLP